MSADSSLGQQGLEAHYAAWFERIRHDFRAVSLNEIICKLTPRGHVLDIGCGSGAMSAELLERGDDVVSQDASDAMLDMCRAYLQQRHLSTEGLRKGSALEVAEQGAFDAVVALDVIEHLDDDVAALGTFRRALKQTGTLVLSVPALSWMYGPKDEQVGHFRRYDKSRLLRVLDEAGFVIDAIRYWNMLGVLFVAPSVISGKRLNENVRYSKSPMKRAINLALRLWFQHVENAFEGPIGLTLIVRAKKKN